MDFSKLAEIIKTYTNKFETRWEDEKYKWQNIKQFQDNWDIDAENFADMLEKAIPDTNLLSARNFFPRGMIFNFVESAPEEVRSMFKNLYNEQLDIKERIQTFINNSEEIRKKYGSEKWKNHFQNENVVSIYLWLKYPEKYYIYKPTAYKNFYEMIDYQPDTNNKVKVIECFKFYDEIKDYIEKQDTEPEEKLSKALASTPDCYADTSLNTLISDMAFFLYQEKKINEKSNDFFVEALKNAQLSFTQQNKFYHVQFTYNTYKMLIRTFNGNTNYISKKQLPNLQEDIYIAIVWYDRNKPETIYLVPATEWKKKNSIFIELENEWEINLTLNKKSQLAPFEFSKVLETLHKQTKTVTDNDNSPRTLPASQTPAAQYTKQEYLKEVYQEDSDYETLESLLQNKKNIILQGCPGVGKSFAAKRLAYAIMSEMDDTRIKYIQFHQNYSYEDFIMGYKPEKDGFILKKGVFYEFCKKAEKDLQRPYFFIIDEINRGNLSKIFGELLLAIENEYRGNPITLAYDEENTFTVPENLYLIGMMNTADRSLAMIDYALRRRFSFFTMKPAFKSTGFQNYQNSLNNKHFDELISIIIELNDAISRDESLGDGFCIGHSYFCHKPAEKNFNSWLKEIVYYDILPTLHEYWFDDKETYEKWRTKLSGFTETLKGNANDN